MSNGIVLAPTWSFAVQIYTEVLQSSGADPDIKRQAVRDLLELARSYEKLAAKLQDQAAEIDALKTRIDRMIEKESEEEAKARIAAAQMELLEDSLTSRRNVYRQPTLSTEQERDD